MCTTHLQHRLPVCMQLHDGLRPLHHGFSSGDFDSLVFEPTHPELSGVVPPYCGGRPGALHGRLAPVLEPHDGSGRSERRAGEVELSRLEGDEERTLGGELFAPVWQSAAGQRQWLLGNKAPLTSTTFCSHSSTGITLRTATDLDLLQDLRRDLLTGEFLWRCVKLQLVKVCRSASQSSQRYTRPLFQPSCCVRVCACVYLLAACAHWRPSLLR